MSIKLPATMVFYGESENRPHYLLWWIPAESYSSLELEAETLNELQTDYPNGFEIEVQDEALSEVGLDLSPWGVTAADLRAAFLQLHNAGKLPPSGMIQAVNLFQLASSKDTEGKKSIHEILSQPNHSFSFSAPIEAHMEVERSETENPEMTSGEDAEDFFKRLSGS